MRWLLRFLWGQNVTTNLYFSRGMVTGFWFTSRLYAWRWVSIGGFKPPGNDVKEWQMHAHKPVRISLTTCNTGCAQNLLILRSPQLSFTSGPSRSCGGRSLDDTWASCQQRAISVKTLVQWSPGLPDLLCCPWNSLFSMIQCWLDHQKRLTLSVVLV